MTVSPTGDSFTLMSWWKKMRTSRGLPTMSVTTTRRK